MPLAFIANDALFHLAIVLVAGIIGGELVGRLRLPKVTGWIATGILLRSLIPYHVEFTGLTVESVARFGPYMNLVLGYIAFTVGLALLTRGRIGSMAEYMTVTSPSSLPIIVATPSDVPSERPATT